MEGLNKNDQDASIMRFPSHCHIRPPSDEKLMLNLSYTAQAFSDLTFKLFNFFIIIYNLKLTGSTDSYAILVGSPCKTLQCY